MLQQFQQHIQNQFPSLKSKKLLLAFSGGIDSVVLAHLLCSLDFNITLAHCNFKLRGAESDEDEKFCLAFADELAIECFTQTFDTERYAKVHKLSIQMAARELRYHWFSELQSSFQFDHVLTAHHADDNIETFFINLLRGSGIKGLTGIPKENGSILRTLLPFTRAQIEDYAQKQHLKWREDSSNQDTKYLRNKIRHELIPKLFELDTDFKSSIIKTMQQLGEAESIICSQIDNLKREGVIEENNDKTIIDIALLLKNKHAESHLFYLLSPYGFTAWDDIKNLLDAQSGKYVDAPNWRLLKDRNVLILKKRIAQEQTDIQISSTDKLVSTSLGALSISYVDELPRNISKNECYVDADKIRFPLVIRNWQAGDFFYPLNGNGRKKLSKFYKDIKKTMFEKSTQLILCDSANAIVWVMEERADDRFKVDQSSKNILKFQLN